MPWEELSRVFIVEGFSSSAELILRDGERIRLPGELVMARRADGERTTLLDEIEPYRPDLTRVADRRRQERAISLALMGAVVALGVVGLYLLTAR